MLEHTDLDQKLANSKWKKETKKRNNQWEHSQNTAFGVNMVHKIDDEPISHHDS